MADIINRKSMELALEHSNQLNQLIMKYRDKTLMITSLLAQEDDNIVFRITEHLEQREIIIKEYENVKPKYEECMNLLGQEMLKLDLKKLEEELKYLAEERRKIFLSIEEIEAKNRVKINTLYNGFKDKIHQISDSKKMLDGYQAIHPLAEGVYFDKRK